MEGFLGDRTVRAMVVNFASIYGAVAGCGILLERKPDEKRTVLAEASVCAGNDAKRRTEDFWLGYAVFWVLCFGLIIGAGMYAWFDRQHYLLVCGGLSAPLLLQPLLWPSLTGEAAVPWMDRHCTRATVWIAAFSFIGNWWFTHYFYNVLEATYTMPAHDVNAVPVAMFLATHFYFTLYHALASKALRCIRRLYMPTMGRWLFTAVTVLAMAYSTAFTESATISAYPCYRFKDIHSAYTLGSAFYGLYFVVSYPVFALLDEPPERGGEAAAVTAGAATTEAAGVVTRSKGAKAKQSSSSSSGGATDGSSYSFSSSGVRSLGCYERLPSLWAVCLESLGAAMAVLMLLDLVRVALGMELHIPVGRPCKSDAALTCAPFTGATC